MNTLSNFYAKIIDIGGRTILRNEFINFSLGSLVAGILAFLIGWWLIRRFVSIFRTGRLTKKIRDKNTRIWLSNFLALLLMLTLMVITFRIFGFSFKIFNYLWSFTLFSIQDYQIKIGNIVMGLILLFPGIRLSGYLSREFQRLFLKQLKLDLASKKAIETLIRYLLIVVVVLFVLTIVGIPLSAFTLIGGAVAIGVGLGSQNLVNNFLSGILLMTERPLKVGDIVEVEGRNGTVEHIGGRSTRIKDFDNVRMVIPNSKLLENTVVNWSLIDSYLRRKLLVGVAYGSPVEQVRDLLIQSMVSHPAVEKEPRPVVLFYEFGDNALIFRMHYWMKMSPDLNPLIVDSDIRFKINELLTAANIVIAFPQRDIHLDTLKPLEVKLTPPAKV